MPDESPTISELLTGGYFAAITKPQSTFVQLALTKPENRSWVFRIHFGGRLEATKIEPVPVRSVEIVPAHPLTLDYVEPTATAWINGPPRDPAKFIADARGIVDSMFNGWRPLDRYLNRFFLDLRHLSNRACGQLAKGPECLMTALVELGTAHRMLCKVEDHRSPGTACSVLLLDDMYVVGTDLRVQIRGTA